MPDAAQMTPAELVARYEDMEPVVTYRHAGAEMRYCAPNRLILWRVETVLEKEPDTIAWIDGFAPGDTLLDIGANIGLYTIWAAVLRGARVFAFEPEAQNYATLCRNIALNNLSERVTGYCAALADESGFGALHVSHASAGHSCHSFGEAVDFHLAPRVFPFAQGSFAVKLDELVQANVVPVPRHIKIDVDGIEHKVVAGAAGTLADPRCASVLVEINRALPEHRRIVERLGELGFCYSQAESDASMRTDGLFKGCGNYVFRR
ncbi:MAG: FkbM family methyltransferase [Alphaproteobacteria bacterium]